MNLYQYGMRKKEYAKGTEMPKPYAVLPKRTKSTRYKDIIVYERELTADECQQYDLDFLGKVE